jgi:sugar/nucleoside kinase (ribokinase family)
MGAALVDTEIRVDDTLLAALGVEKGLMTLVDEQRRAELLGALDGHLVEASHASGGSAGNSVIATALFGGPCYMSCRVADDEDGASTCAISTPRGYAIRVPPATAPRPANAWCWSRPMRSDP